jgi:hypothetical protein
MKRLPSSVKRIAAGSVLTVAFLFMASVFAPDLTLAYPEPVPLMDPTGFISNTVTSGSVNVPESLGVIESDRYLVEVFASPAGPRYSVIDRQNGAPLGLLMTADEVAEWFPDLPIPEMDFGVEGALMLADPADMHRP